jgi:hypothetical protein
MSSRAKELLGVVALAATAMGGTMLDGSPIRAPRNRRRETIDDVLDRARRRRGKPAFDPSIDGRAGETEAPIGAPRIFTGRT